jgi:hypothetical protein
MSKDLSVVEPQSEVAIIFENISSGLAAFETRKAELTALKDKADGLEIKGVDDKDGIKQVSTLRKELKKARVDIQNEGKAMRDPLTKVSKSISAKENELVDIIEPTEKALKSKEDWVDSEIERIKREEQEKEEKRIQTRIDRLAEYGYAIDINFLKGIDDDQFEKVVDNARQEHEKEVVAKTEADRLQKEKDEQAERDRIELKTLREKQEEADRIIREKEQELERKRQEIEKQQREAEQRAKLFKDQAELTLWRKRTAELKEVGGNGQFLFKKWKWQDQDNPENLVITFEEGVSISDEAFAKLRDKHNAEAEQVLEERRIAEEKRANEEEDRRQAEVERIRKEAAEKALAEEKASKEEEERQEQERLAKASDKDKFQSIVTQIEGLIYPDMKSAKYKKLLVEVKELQAKVVAHIKAKV